MLRWQKLGYITMTPCLKSVAFERHPSQLIVYNSRVIFVRKNWKFTHKKQKNSFGKVPGSIQIQYIIDMAHICILLLQIYSYFFFAKCNVHDSIIFAEKNNWYGALSMNWYFGLLRIKDKMAFLLCFQVYFFLFVKF